MERVTRTEMDIPMGMANPTAQVTRIVQATRTVRAALANRHGPAAANDPRDPVVPHAQVAHPTTIVKHVAVTRNAIPFATKVPPTATDTVTGNAANATMTEIDPTVTDPIANTNDRPARLNPAPLRSHPNAMVRPAAKQNCVSIWNDPVTSSTLLRSAHAWRND